MNTPKFPDACWRQDTGFGCCYSPVGPPAPPPPSPCPEMNENKRFQWGIMRQISEHEDITSARGCQIQCGRAPDSGMTVGRESRTSTTASSRVFTTTTTMKSLAGGRLAACYHNAWWVSQYNGTDRVTTGEEEAFAGEVCAEQLAASVATAVYQTVVEPLLLIRCVVLRRTLRDRDPSSTRRCRQVTSGRNYFLCLRKNDQISSFTLSRSTSSNT